MSLAQKSIQFESISLINESPTPYRNRVKNLQISSTYTAGRKAHKLYLKSFISETLLAVALLEGALNLIPSRITSLRIPKTKLFGMIPSFFF